MRATPQELASRNDSTEMREWILTETDPRKIQELFHRISVRTHGDEFSLGQQAVGILIAESADASARRLEKSTKHLLFLTYVLVALTLVLTILTYLLMKHPQ